MSGHRARLTVVLAGLCGIAAAAMIVSLAIGCRTGRTAREMESFEWIHNDRCLSKVSATANKSAEFGFAVLGDVQVGTSQLPRLVKELERYGPIAFIVQTGDISSHPDAGHYDVLLHALARSGLGTPMFVLPGNHDIEDGGELFEKYFGPRQTWFEYGEALFVLLDNSIGPFDEAQYEWLEGLLKDHRSRVRNVFLFMHRQPIHWEGDGKYPVEDHYARLFQLLREYKVGYVFTGNWHGYHREERDGTVFVVNGQGGDFSHNKRMVPCFFTLVEVENGAVEDGSFVLSPRITAVMRSLIDDWLIAHMGEPAWRNRSTMLFLIIAAALGCVWLIVLSRRSNLRDGG